MKLTINGQREVTALCRSKFVEDAISILNRLPDGQLLTIRVLGERMKRARTTMSCEVSNPMLADYRIKVNQSQVYYGNPKTIKQARKQLIKEGK